jgi:hypothetical protein
LSTPLLLPRFGQREFSTGSTRAPDNNDWIDACGNGLVDFTNPDSQEELAIMINLSIAYLQSLGGVAAALFNMPVLASPIAQPTVVLNNFIYLPTVSR